MNASTRAFALRAAAKAALSVSLAACGGATVASGADHTALDSDDDRDASAMPTEGGSDAVTLRDAPAAPCSGLGGGSVSSDTFWCCVSYLAPTTDAGFGALGVDAASPSASACCNAVIDYVDHDPSGAAVYAAAESVLPACCEDGTPRVEGPACTLWGPPVPPAMPTSEVA